MDFTIEDNRIFYSENLKILAEVTFPSVKENLVNINHTFVDESLRGQGVAGKLITAVMEELRRTNRKAECSCSYAKTWSEKHTEYSDVFTSKPAQIETERLILRAHKEDDFPAMCKLYMNKTNMRYVPEIYCPTKDAVMESLKNSQTQESLPVSKRFQYFFAMEEKATHKYCGETGITLESFAADGKCLADLGYFMDEDFQGKGYMSEAVKAVIDFAFRNLPVQKIKTGCLQENIKSERVMIKAGVKKEGLLLGHQFHEGVWKNRLVYGLSREDWLSKK